MNRHPYLAGPDPTYPDNKDAILEDLNLAKQKLELHSKGTSKGSVAVIPKEKKLSKCNGMCDITK